MKRRQILKLGGLIALTGAFAPDAVAAPPDLAMSDRSDADLPADYTLRIASGTVALSDKVVVSTTLYNGTFPGPMLRVAAGKRVVVDVENHTRHAEQVAWHGQFLDDGVDGAAEERTPYVQPHGKRRIAFRANPSGLHYYHSLIRAGADLRLGMYSGLAGPLFVDAPGEPGLHDREVFLTLKEFEPYFTPLAGRAPPTSADLDEQALVDLAAGAAEAEPGTVMGVAYRSFAINGRMLGAGEPVRVRSGERVLFHVINASATTVRRLAFPGHRFNVIALDGHPVPTRATVEVLRLAPGERVSALVNMTQPGIWQLAEPDRQSREHGMGVVVEYAGQRGKAVWQAPAQDDWNYLRFADLGRTAATPDETINVLLTMGAPPRSPDFVRWLVNGASYDQATMPITRALHRGRRYRLRIGNATAYDHPIHLHRFAFELTWVSGRTTAGVMKDVVLVPAYRTVEVDFTADRDGLTLAHGHNQLQMDGGLMALYAVVGQPLQAPGSAGTTSPAPASSAPAPSV